MTVAKRLLSGGGRFPTQAKGGLEWGARAPAQRRGFLAEARNRDLRIYSNAHKLTYSKAYMLKRLYTHTLAATEGWKEANRVRIGGAGARG